jgi:hypothetical protein
MASKTAKPKQAEEAQEQEQERDPYGPGPKEYTLEDVAYWCYLPASHDLPTGKIVQLGINRLRVVGAQIELCSVGVGSATAKASSACGYYPHVRIFAYDWAGALRQLHPSTQVKYARAVPPGDVVLAPVGEDVGSHGVGEPMKRGGYVVPSDALRDWIATLPIVLHRFEVDRTYDPSALPGYIGVSDALRQQVVRQATWACDLVDGVLDPPKPTIYLSADLQEQPAPY